MKTKRRLSKLITIVIVCIAVCVCIPTLSAAPAIERGTPAPEYQDMQGLPEDVEYNSEGIPILGKNLTVNDIYGNVFFPQYNDLPSYSLYYINGYAIPFSSYPINSYWSGSYRGAIECVAFARYIYDTLWGNREGSYFSNYDTSSTTKAERVIESLANGTRITAYKGTKSHTMIKTTHTAYPDGVIVYHANYVPKSQYNKVTLTYFTYSEFSELFDYINGYNPPN